MNSSVALILSALGYLVVLGQALALVLLAFLVLPIKKQDKLYEYYLLIKQNALTSAFIIASTATLGSLFFSEVAGFGPCKFCWYQRIFMYPMSIILLVSLLKNDKNVVRYVLPLAIGGGLIAVYQYIMQLFPTVIRCSEEVAECSSIQVAQFGFVTIPLMSATAFALIILLSLIAAKKK